jgi:hypothetical protein
VGIVRPEGYSASDMRQMWPGIGAVPEMGEPAGSCAITSLPMCFPMTNSKVSMPI